MAQHVTSPSGLKLIKAFEGFRANAAALGNGRWTIGYGHTVSARAGLQISRQDASDLLKWDIRKLEASINELTFAPLLQNQFDALISFAYNIGIENFAKSSVLLRINEGCAVDAAAGFDNWRRARFADQIIVVDALVRRRAAEKALFLATPGTRIIAPTPQLPPLCDVQMAMEHEPETPLSVIVDLEGSNSPFIDTAPDTIAGGDSEPDIENDNHDTENEAGGLVALDDALTEHNIIADTGPTAQPDSRQVLPDTQNQGRESASNPVAAMAERITGRLEAVGTEAPEVSEAETADTIEADQTEAETPEATEAETVVETPQNEEIEGVEDSVATALNIEESAAIEEANSNPLPPENTDVAGIAALAGEEKLADEETLVSEEKLAGQENQALIEPPLVDEDDILLETYDSAPPVVEGFDATYGADEYSDQTHYDQSLDITPQAILPESQPVEKPQSFQPAYDRGRWVFIMMGVIGIALTLLGFWQILTGISLVTTFDYIKGPGLAVLGLLFALTSANNLLRRLSQ